MRSKGIVSVMGKTRIGGSHRAFRLVSGSGHLEKTLSHRAATEGKRSASAEERLFSGGRGGKKKALDALAGRGGSWREAAKNGNDEKAVSF